MKRHSYILVIIFMILSLSFHSSAQLILQWDKTLGGSGSDKLSSVVPTADGGYLLGGTSDSSPSGDKSTDARGPDYWVIKVDEFGNKLWDKTFGTPFDEDFQWSDYLYTLTPLTDGGFLLAGSGNYALWVIRIDAMGNMVWDSRIGGFGDDYYQITNIIVTTEGDFLIGGDFQSSGNVEFGLNKLSSDGRLVWTKVFSGKGDDYLRNIAKTSDGGFLLGGYSDSDASGNKTEDSKGAYDFWIVKTDATGSVLWDKTIGGNGNDELHSILSTSDGGYILGGYSDSGAFGNKTEDSKGAYDFWIVKTDATGNVLWDKTIGGNATDLLYQILPFHENSYLLGGASSSSASGDKSEDSKGGMDFWTIVVDSEGNPTWDKTIGSAGGDIFQSMTKSEDGGYVLAGTSNANASGDKSENSRGGDDFWAVKVIGENNTFVKQLSWVDAQSDSEIQTLKDGDVINLAELSTNLFSIKANILPETVDRVELEITGPINHQQTERRSPYALFGDQNGNISGREWPEGKYIIKVTPYIMGKSSISTSLTFQLMRDATSAQPDIEWDNTLGGMMDDVAANAIPTPDGGYLIAGTSDSNSSGEKSEDRLGNTDYWVVKTDARGNKQWDKTFGGTEKETLIEAFHTEDGGFLLAGHSDSGDSGNKTATQMGSWLVKIDAQGRKIWDKNIDGEPFLLISPASDKGYLLVSGTFTQVLTKLNEKGEITWRKAFEFTNFDDYFTIYPESIIPTANEGYIIGGYIYPSGVENHLWLAKIDAEGDKEWDKVIQGVGRLSRMKNISAVQSGGYFLGVDEGGLGYDYPGGLYFPRSFLVLKIDEQGNEYWRKKIGGGADDFLTSSIVANNDGLILAGRSNSPISGNKTEGSKGEFDFWLIEIDADGNSRWNKTIGGAAYDEPHHITMTHDDGYLVTGHSYSHATGDKSEDSRGGADFWIVKLRGTHAPLSVSNIALVNAESNQEIQVIQEGDIINLKNLPTTLFNFEVHTYPSKLGSVAIALSGPIASTQTENHAPYALFGDNPRGDYNGQELLPGKYQITATSYSDKLLSGVAGAPKTINFTIVNSDLPLYGIKLDLYDAVDNIKLFTLENGSTVDLNKTTNQQLTVIINTMPEEVGSVEAVLSGPINYTHIENIAPYALFRNSGSDYYGRNFPPGTYILSATAYEKPNAQGREYITKTVTFYVTDGGLSDEKTTDKSRLRVFPVPTSGLVNIRIKTVEAGTEVKLLNEVGSILFQQTADQPFYQLDLTDYSPGVYFLKFANSKYSQTIRIVKN